MTDTRLHLRLLREHRADVVDERSVCGLLLRPDDDRRYMTILPSEVAHAIHADGDICAECIAKA